MKKIIDGKIYDTDNAEIVGVYDNGVAAGDLDYISETLYQKKNGKFFLAGEGGARTRYCSIAHDGFGCGERLVPLSVDDARDWGERHLKPDIYARYFGEIADDVSKKIVAISIPVSTHESAKRIAADRGISLSALITELLDNASN